MVEELGCGLFEARGLCLLDIDFRLLLDGLCRDKLLLGLCWREIEGDRESDIETEEKEIISVQVWASG